MKKGPFLENSIITLSYKHAYVRFMFTFKFSSHILCDTNEQRKLPSYLQIHVMNKTLLPIKIRYNLVAEVPACADNISGSQFMINKNHQRQDYLLVTR